MFFVITIVAVTFGLLSYSLLTSKLEERSQGIMQGSRISEDIKEKFFYCYASSEIIEKNRINNSCNLPYDYNLSILHYGACTAETLKINQFDSEKNTFKKEKIIINVAIRSDNKICPGKLEVYI